MKTPITDKAKMKWAHGESAQYAIIETSRKLELDRAALMESLENMIVMVGTNDLPIAEAIKTLSAARANFPNED